MSKAISKNLTSSNPSITTNKNFRFLTMHLLFNVPANRCNRDGNNRPKTINYNGVDRQRWSSQCMKRVIREGFNYVSDISKEDLIAEIDNFLEEHKNIENEKESAYITKVKSYRLPKGLIEEVCLGKLKKKKNGEEEDDNNSPEVAVHISLAELANLKKTKEWKNFPNLDILIFGRMFASKTDGNKLKLDNSIYCKYPFR